MDAIRGELHSIRTSMDNLREDYQQSREEYLRDYHKLDKQTALTSQSVSEMAATVKIMAEGIDKLDSMADRWRGVVITCLFLGPIVGSVIGGVSVFLLRLWLFGEPLSKTPGLVK